MKIFGLIGKNIEYSFSRKYFSNKFETENIRAVYKNFDLQDIKEFPAIVSATPGAGGFNVTIPYKEAVIPYLDRMDGVAQEIGAVNTIKIETDGSLTGYNTDYFGFTESIKPFLQVHHSRALILGTGGASKAVAFALEKLGIEYKFVSRRPKPGEFTYSQLTEDILHEYTIIINCTPLGTYPNLKDLPAIPVNLLNARHLIFDLIYNPPITQLMRLAMAQGATALNGQQMLELQAEKAWQIWTGL